MQKLILSYIICLLAGVTTMAQSFEYKTMKLYENHKCIDSVIVVNGLIVVDTANMDIFIYNHDSLISTISYVLDSSSISKYGFEGMSEFIESQYSVGTAPLIIELNLLTKSFVIQPMDDNSRNLLRYYVFKLDRKKYKNWVGGHGSNSPSLPHD